MHTKNDDQFEARDEMTPHALAAVARRGFMLATLGFTVTSLLACAAKAPKSALASGGSAAPEGLWTERGGLPPKRYAQPATPADSTASAAPASTAKTSARTNTATTAKPAAAANSTYAPASIPSGYSAKPIPRRAWTTFVPDAKGMEAMPTVTRITVHHEGNGPYYGTSVTDVRARLVNVLNGEMNAKNPHKDIAYHFVIDPAGRVWEARDLKWEGRHTRNNYDTNLGVMCLGNFEEQSISPAQLASLEKFIKQMQLKYKIPKKRVYTHQELSATLCPGKDLQKKMGAMRTRLK